MKYLTQATAKCRQYVWPTTRASWAVYNEQDAMYNGPESIWHHQKPKPWAHRPLESDASLTIWFHLFPLCANQHSTCRLALHQSAMSWPSCVVISVHITQNQHWSFDCHSFCNVLEQISKHRLLDLWAKARASESEREMHRSRASEIFFSRFGSSEKFHLFLSKHCNAG